MSNKEEKRYVAIIKNVHTSKLRGKETNIRQYNFESEKVFLSCDIGVDDDDWHQDTVLWSGYVDRIVTI